MAKFNLEFIKARRQELGITSEEMARSLGVVGKLKVKDGGGE